MLNTIFRLLFFTSTLAQYGCNPLLDSSQIDPSFFDVDNGDDDSSTTVPTPTPTPTPTPAPTNLPPTVANTLANLTEDTPQSIVLPYLDPENDQATICEVDTVIGGTASTCTCSQGNCSVNFVPTQDLVGNSAGSFRYRVMAQEFSNYSYVTINITDLPLVLDSNSINSHINNVSINESISLTFNQPLNTSSAADKILIYDNTLGRAISTHVLFSNANRTITVSPDVQMKNSGNYQLQILSNLEESGGTQLGANQNSNFITDDLYLRESGIYLR